MIRQKASLLVTETKFLCGSTRRLLSSAGGTAGVATMHKTITKSRTISVRAIMMRYNLANGRKFVDRELSLSIIYVLTKPGSSPSKIADEFDLVAFWMRICLSVPSILSLAAWAQPIRTQIIIRRHLNSPIEGKNERFTLV